MPSPIIDINPTSDLYNIVRQCNANFHALMMQSDAQVRAVGKSEEEIHGDVDRKIAEAVALVEGELGDAEARLNTAIGDEATARANKDLLLDNMDRSLEQSIADINNDLSQNYVTHGDLVAALIGYVENNVQEWDYSGFTYKTHYDTDGTTIVSQCVPYSTNVSNEESPYASKHGRVVNLTGAFKEVGTRPNTAIFEMGYVPSGCEPLRTVKIRQQGSGQNSYLLMIHPTGQMTASRYGVASNIAVANNAWLNINATYISKE